MQGRPARADSRMLNDAAKFGQELLMSTDVFPLPAVWRGKPIAAALFDVDGTLLDTAGDIALALNRAIGEYGWPQVPPADVRHMIGWGAPMLVEPAARAPRRELDKAMHAAMVEHFFYYYGALEETGECGASAFDGAADALRTLHAAGLRIAVVTNKQQRFANAL